jgi:hypothetical protein
MQFKKFSAGLHCYNTNDTSSEEEIYDPSFKKASGVALISQQDLLDPASERTVEDTLKFIKTINQSSTNNHLIQSHSA